MNVKKLKELLENYDDDVKVLLSIDDDGNAFHEMAEENPLEGKIVDASFAGNVEVDSETNGTIDCIVLFPR